jgi:SAM-dependent methyltransferase
MENTLTNFLKKTPIDFGQGSMRHRTAGKTIALDLIRSGKRGWALDVGCRDGFYSRLLKQKGYRVVSIDIQKRYDKTMLADANKELPFQNDVFSLIWCSEVIEHLDDVEETLKRFYRVLKPGGEMILTTPNSYFWFFRIAGILGLPPFRLQRADHKHFFSKPQIDSLFPGATVYGFFPYCLYRFRIKQMIGLLSPTFIIHSTCEC